jgi:hypothetical protein
MNNQAVITACGVTKKITGAGVEIYIGKKKHLTLVELENAVRTVYPRGGEYTHSTHWKVKLTPDYIENTMLRVAFGIMQEAVHRLP